MKIKKLLLLPLIAALLTGCDFLSDAEEKADAKLYHLTLTSNIELTNEQKNELKATYAYGVRSTTVVEGIRPQEEIDDLKDAGASEADIEKAGKRQSDGSYYFFDQDPMFIQAPNVAGYKMTGFYEEDKFSYKPGLTDVDHQMVQSIWNMNSKDTTLQARYEKLTYSYYFNNMETGDINPNNNGIYCFLDDGVKSLLPATTSNPHKHFIGWEYEDTINLDANGYSTWVLLEDGVKLPTNYTEESMRINARWEIDMFEISFDFVKDSGGSLVNLDYDDVIESMSVVGNMTTVDGVKEECKGYPGTSVTKASKIKMEYGSWLSIYFNLKEGLIVSYFEINGIKETTIDASGMGDPYINIHSDKVGNDYVINCDSVITFVLY